MADEFDRAIMDAMRASRDSAIDMCVELCALIRDHGGCPQCCIDQIRKTQAELHASDLTHDALEKAARR